MSSEDLVSETTPLTRQSRASNFREGTWAIYNHVTETTRTAYAQCRPWSEFISCSSFGKPESLGDALFRLRQNVSCFSVNYSIILLVAAALSLIRRPLPLVAVLLLICAWLFLYLLRTEALVILNRSFSDNHVLIFLSILTIVMLVLLKVVSAIIISSLIAALLICLHGAFWVPTDLYSEEANMSGAGYLSIPVQGRSQPLEIPSIV